MLILTEVNTGTYRLFDNIAELSDYQIDMLQRGEVRLFTLGAELIPKSQTVWLKRDMGGHYGDDDQ